MPHAVGPPAPIVSLTLFCVHVWGKRMEHSRNAPTARDQGSSLLELLMSLGILSTVVTIVSMLLVSSSDSQQYAINLVRATELNQAILDQVRADLLSSVRVFQGDAIGNAYLGRLDRTGLSRRISTALPIVDATGIPEREATARSKTGNDLLFARHAWTTEFQASSGTPYHVDVYRLVHYGLAVTDGGPRAGSHGGVDMFRWISEPLADGDQIDQITDLADRAEVLSHLALGTAGTDGEKHPRVQLAWVLGADPATIGTIRQIDLSAGDLSVAPVAPRTLPWVFRRDTERSKNAMLGGRGYSIASIHSPAARFGIGRFAVKDSTGDGFPHGFEVQIVGSSSGRQVVLHSTLLDIHERGQRAVSDLTCIVDAKDI